MSRGGGVVAADVLAEALVADPCGAWVDRLAALPLGLAGEEQVALVAALERQRRHLDALINRALCGVDPTGCDDLPPVTGRRSPHRCPGGAACTHDWSGEELGLALQISPQSARCRLETARGLCARLPEVQQALHDGTTSTAHARIAYDLLGHLDEHRRNRIWTRVRARLTTTTPGQFAGLLRRTLASTADPDDTVTEHRQALRDRAGITIHPGHDGLATAAVTGAASDLHRLADWARDAGHLPAGAPPDNLTAGQRQIRALLHALFPGVTCDTAPTPTGPGRTGGTPAAADSTGAAAAADSTGAATTPAAGTPPPVALHLTMSLTAWLGLSNEAATLDDDTPVPAALARAWAQVPTSIQTAIYTSTTRGTTVLHRLGRQHRLPTAAIRDLVAARDQRCQWPGCPRKATTCHLDHLTPWADGGCTDPENLHALCARHHNLRHTLNWTPHRSDDNGTTWTPPTPRSRLHPDPGRLPNTPPPPPGAQPWLPPDHHDPNEPPAPF